MANLGGFRREDAPEDEFSPLVKGTYDVVISETSLHPYRSGDGEMLKVTYEIIGEKDKGRKIFDYMNLWHPTSAIATKIAWTQMGKILDAVGKISVEDSNELCNIPMTIDVDIEDGSRNKITKYHPKVAKQPAQAATTPAPAAQAASVAPATGSAKKAPWEK